jgi:LCP family protein required for cell wall assembly
MSNAPEPGIARDVPLRPWLAALLSFLFPGAGQAYAGRWVAAAVFALPAIALVGALAFAWTTNRTAIFDNEILVALLVVNGGLLAWRGVAIVEAGLNGWSRQEPRQRRTTMLAVAGLLVAAVAMHAWVGVVILQLQATLAQVFVPDATPVSVDPGASVDPFAEPTPTPQPAWDGTERLNILLLGTDAGPGRTDVLTDVVLVVSVDPVAETAVMISIPRDTGYLPLADTSIVASGLYPDKVNTIMGRAERNAAAWCPDLDASEAEACGLRAVREAVGLYLGIEIDHHALVDMAGFTEVIDAIGGVELCLPGRLVDPQFEGTITDRYADGLVLPEGCHTYDGLDALAYARSRKGWIEMPDGSIEGQSDFDRAERQQQLLLAMRRELSNADTILELPGLLAAVARTVSTDVERGEAAEMSSLLPLVAGTEIERVVLDYPTYVELPEDPGTNYLLVPRRDVIRAKMAEIFGEEPVGWYLGSDASAPEEGP